MKFYLIVAKGTRKGMPIPITVDLFMMGSGKMCQLRAKNLPPEQCALITRENSVFVRDMGSGEPTLVNGTVVPTGSEWPMHAGDHLELGPLDFIIQVHERSLSQKDMEEWASSCLDKDSERLTAEEDEFHQPTNASEAAAKFIDHLNALKGEVKGRLRIGIENGITTVSFSENKLVEDSEITFINKELCDHLLRPNLRVLLDCKNVERMSTAAVIMIREFAKRVNHVGSTMALCRVRKDLKDILTVLSQDHIPVYVSKTVALTQKW